MLLKPRTCPHWSWSNATADCSRGRSSNLPGSTLPPWTSSVTKRCRTAPDCCAQKARCSRTKPSPHRRFLRSEWHLATSVVQMPPPPSAALFASSLVPLHLADKVEPAIAKDFASQDTPDG